MKRLLAILCTLALVLSVASSAVFAAENSSLQAAIDDDISDIIVLEEDASNITVNRDTYLDLNGHNVDGVTVLAGTLYCMDSQTADYTVADGVYGHVTNVTGSVKAAPGYLQVGDSFHAVNLDIYAMTLRAADVGVYYKSRFAADEVVAAQVESFGVALSVVTAPSAENLETYCGYSQFTGFEAGEGANSASSSTLLKNIMKAANGDEKNAKNAAMPVYGRAYIKTSEGYVFGETVKRSLQEQVEAIDGVWETLSDAQKTPVLSMLESYTAVMENWEIPNIQGIQAPGADEEIEIPIEVTAENGVVTEAVTVEQDEISITIPAGTKLAEGVESLTLTVTPKETSEAGLTLEKSEVLMPMDVHVDGLAADNAQPLTIYLGKVMAENLNMGNYTVYHVENGKANEMVLIPVGAEFTAHNQYKYTLDGELTLYMASFSEVAVVSDVNNAWEGKRDYSWYNTTDEVLYIRNADQLAGFGAIVGGMAKTADQVEIEQDTFAGKTVILLADISIGDLTDEDGRNVVFYPIGYYNSTGSYEKVSGGSVTSNVSSFEGTFDGNGNTISDFYQNTWEMFGDYNDGYSGTPNHYKDAMGLFGYVLNGTVKNLTVRNFKSDGEFTPTGVIAAYACNSTFENIAIVKCNPRVYNTGNGGIIGIAGNNGDQDTEILLKNITVDKSNKITALWGSWDVACGGLVGMFRGNAEGGNGKIHFENCHVAAQIDVYNDVCANYQYYAYRYSGMMIGSVRHNQTIDGHVYPNMDGITASGCTVHFGDWNDYYYCELVANTTASYTHDHQMSRLVQIADINVDEMKYLALGATEWAEIPTSGRVNYVVVKEYDEEKKMWIHGDGHDYAECYHFVDGAVWNHEDAGSHDNPFIDENGDDVADLKEDKQLVYREFNNLFTGYGWGVTTKAISDFAEEDIRILDKALDGGSADKFLQAENFRGEKPYPAGAEIRLEDLFQMNAAQNIDIIGANVQVTVSPVDENGTVKATYTPNYTDWTKGTLKFDKDFEGAAFVTITDYYFCNPLTLTVNVTKYTADLYFENLENKTAYCPVCNTKPNWKVVDAAKYSTSALPKGSAHYFLSQEFTYSGSGAFIPSPGAGSAICFHLNGQEMKITTSVALAWSSNGAINVMGDGQVTKQAGTNGIFHTNTNGATHEHNVYGGKYLSETGYVISVGNNGGVFKVYKDVVMESTSATGIVVNVGTSALRSSIVDIEGAEIKGKINVSSPKRTTSKHPTKPNYTAPSASSPNGTQILDSAGDTYVTLTDAKVTGTVSFTAPTAAAVADGSALYATISGSTKIGTLSMNSNATVTLDNLTAGAKIGVSAKVGVPFTVASENAEAYRPYFYATTAKNAVFVENDQLVCKVPTYTDNLEFKADGKTAYCPKCQADVQWIKITASQNLHKSGVDNAHFYLDEDFHISDKDSTFSGPSYSTSKTACFHLNGHNITNTLGAVFFSSSGKLYVMGSGTVTGGTTGTGNASTVAANTYTNGSITLCSGTYKDMKLNNNNTDRYVVSINNNGGWIEIYEDVTIKSVNNKAVRVGETGLRYSKLIVDGATIEGNVVIANPVRKENGTRYTDGGYDPVNGTMYEGKLYKTNENPNYATAAQTTVELTDVTIDGTVTVNFVDMSGAEKDPHSNSLTLTIAGATTMDKLVLKNAAKVTLGELDETVNILVTASGAENVNITSADSGKIVYCKDGVINVEAETSTEPETPAEPEEGTEEETTGE